MAGHSNFDIDKYEHIIAREASKWMNGPREKNSQNNLSGQRDDGSFGVKSIPNFLNGQDNERTRMDKEINSC
jgi:hypothetical protein